MNVLPKFSESLTELMRDSNLNAERLGKLTNISPAQIGRYTKGKDISLAVLLRLAEYFNCSLDYLCGRSDVKLSFTPKQCPPLMEWLPAVIKESGKTTYKVFKNTRIKSSYFVNWRKGGKPLLSSLGELADYLECSLDRLIGRDR